MLAPLLVLALAPALHSPAAAVTKDIVYRTVDDTGIKADFYYPDQPLANPAPFVLVIHGGSWTSGKKEDMGPLCEALAQKGLASATVDYRLSKAGKNLWPVHIQDVQSAVRYFRANAEKYKINPNKFGVTGASAGGHLALLVGADNNWEPDAKDNPKTPENVIAVLNFFGPTDLSQDFSPAIANIVCSQVLGKKYDPADKDVINLSPVSHLTKQMPPVFTIQGDADPVVPPKQAVRLDDALKALGVESVLVKVPKMGHEFPMQNPDFVKALEQGLDWMKSKLK